MIGRDPQEMKTDRMPLTDGWRFHYGDCPEAWYAGFRDDAWERVFVPHDYAVAAPFDERYSSGTGYLRGGTAWYRIRFCLPASAQGKTVRLRFDGIYKNSRVWCNSCFLGERPSGYATVVYDISHCVKTGSEENVVSVRVSHEDISDSRWFTGSGITRPVTVLIDEPVHLSEPGGVFFTASGITYAGVPGQGGGEQPVRAERAGLRLRLTFENAGCVPATVRARAYLLETGKPAPMERVAKASPDDREQPDSHGPQEGTRAEHRVLSGSSEEWEQIASASFGELEGTIAEDGGILTLQSETMIGSPKLWSPEHPFLYRLYVVYETKPVHDASGAESVVSVSGPVAVGIRSAEFDPDHGFFLNGVPTKFRGVCVHEDAGCLGAAVPKEVWERRLELLKDCGVNAIRMSHNPHAQALYELCDELGFLVMDEAFDEWENAKNKWWQGHNVYPPRHEGSFASFPFWHEQDLCAMVRTGQNHPSIVLWSIGNEIDYPNDPYCHESFASMTGNNDANKPAAERQYDPQKPDMRRLATIAGKLADIVRREDDTREVTLAAAFPELSANLGFIDALRVVGYNYKEEFYEADHRRFPDKVFLGSENGHSREAWQAVTGHDFICGQFLWTGIDYLGEAQGWPVHGSPAGLLTTAGFPKDRYFERKELWAGTPEVIPTGCDPGNRCPEGTGATASTDNGGAAGGSGEDVGACRESVSGKAISVTVTRWMPRRAGADAAGAASWEEASQKSGFVEQYLLQLVNAAGAPVQADDRDISVRAEGPCEVIGLDNGDLADLTPYTEKRQRRTYRGDLAVYVRRLGAGEIRLVAEILP